MDAVLLNSLTLCETDIDGALERFCGDESLYLSCLTAFVEDATMSDLLVSIDAASWDDAFTAAHSLKGLAGNMGFIPLFHSTAELVVAIRNGKHEDIPRVLAMVKRCYMEISDVIRLNCKPPVCNEHCERTDESR